MKKFFTLIELIIVIVTIGVLAAIVVPNISTFKQEASHTAILSNLKSLQTSVDMYLLDENGDIPGIDKPTEIKPSQIDFGKLYPEYTRDIPENKKMHYWVDYKGMVWASSVDSPIVQMQRGEGDKVTVTWSEDPNATKYNIYEVEGYEGDKGKVSGKADPSKAVYKSITQINSTVFTEGKLNTTYVVSAVDATGLETAPSGVGYTGYQNQKPVALFSILNEGLLTESTIIVWDTSESFDVDGDTLTKFEWKINDTPVASPNENFPQIGSYKVELRVQDSKGNWSNWYEETISISQSNRAPVAVISMNPQSSLTTNTSIAWGYASSTDADGDAIQAAEWQLNEEAITSTPLAKILAIGSHTMKLRVKDTRGLWSPWVSKDFQIAEYKGSGTSGEPYLISTADDLNAVRGGIRTGWDMNKHYRLVNDIDLSSFGNFDPLGALKTSFDGNNFTIRNLTSNNTSIGLFNSISSTGSVSRLGIVNANYSGAHGGAIAFSNSGIIQNSYATGTINATNIAGGLVYYNYNEIRYSHFDGNITAVNSAGGIAATNLGSTAYIHEVFSRGVIRGGNNVGGIVGQQTGSGPRVFDSYSTANVTGNQYIGGIVGWHGSGNSSTIYATYSTGIIEGNSFVGGIAGRINNVNTERSSIYRSYALNPKIIRTTASGSNQDTFHRVVGTLNGGTVDMVYGVSDMTFINVPVTPVSNDRGVDGYTYTRDQLKGSNFMFDYSGNWIAQPDGPPKLNRWNK